MSCRTVTRFLLVCSVVLCATAVFAQAPSTIFQLNGNSALDTTYNPNCTGYAPPCDYWNLINTTGVSGSGIGHSSVNTFILGSASTNAFTGGHSKDALPISGWAYTSTNTPPKDGLNAGYAAAYNISDFDIIFGADRFEGSGDANIGIWFFQNCVDTSGGSFVQCGTTTPATHVNGDVFIVSAFVNGGGTPQIAVYSWDQPGLANTITSNDGQVGCSKASNNSPGVKDCASANLLVLVPLGISNCNSSSLIACAISNTATVTATWASYNSPSDTITSPFFFSGGIDITAAFAAVGGSVPCFSSFLEETRSSQQISAVLKDFLLGSFPVCGVSITKACTSASITDPSGTTTYNFSGTVTNTGVGALYDVTVTDTYPTGATNTSLTQPTLPDTCGGNACLQGGHSATYSGSFTLSTSNNSAVNMASVAAAISNGGSTTCPPNGAGICAGPVSWTGNGSGACAPIATSGLTVTKTCTTSVSGGSAITVTVNFSGTVSNPATGDNVDVTGVTLCDVGGSNAACPSTAGSLQITSPANGNVGTLKPGDSVNYSGSYTAVSPFSCTGSNGVCSFTDTVFATGTGADGSGAKTASAGATCHLCPFGACSGGN